MAAVYITNAMLQYIHGSDSHYKDALERKRKVAAEETERAAQKIRAAKSLGNLIAKIVK